MVLKSALCSGRRKHLLPILKEVFRQALNGRDVADALCSDRASIAELDAILKIEGDGCGEGVDRIVETFAALHPYKSTDQCLWPHGHADDPAGLASLVVQASYNVPDGRPSGQRKGRPDENGYTNDQLQPLADSERPHRPACPAR